MLEVELQFEDEYFVSLSDMGQLPGPVGVEVSAVMRDAVWIMAPDYPTAFTRLGDLFEQWTKEYAPKPRLTAVHPSIEPLRVLPGGAK